jgi:hypothetical protein
VARDNALVSVPNGTILKGNLCVYLGMVVPVFAVDKGVIAKTQVHSEAIAVGYFGTVELSSADGIEGMFYREPEKQLIRECDPTTHRAGPSSLLKELYTRYAQPYDFRHVKLVSWHNCETC